jgi:hypothetical protein
MKALREITTDDYMDLAQNGARVLFNIDDYRLIDGIKGSHESYFVKDFGTERWFLIDIDTCYELVTAFFCGGDESYIKECIEEIINSVD